MSVDRSYSLLITDDDPVARATLHEIFVPAGFRTILASSGEEAIDLAREQDVHLALLDFHLPRLTGLETLTILRQLKGVLPSILISADLDEHLRRQAFSSDVFTILHKPISKNLVVYVVNKALEKYYSLHT